MSYIEVKEHDPGPGNEYNASEYPGNGLYWVERLRSYYVVGPDYAAMAGFPAVGRALETKNVPNGDYIHPEYGLTIRQHAALALRVPMSGDPELDAMIREARRLDMATAAISVMDWAVVPSSDCAAGAFTIADALLAAQGKQP